MLKNREPLSIDEAEPCRVGAHELAPMVQRSRSAHRARVSGVSNSGGELV
jgi:hypothetical protein